MKKAFAILTALFLVFVFPNFLEGISNFARNNNSNLTQHYGVGASIAVAYCLNICLVLLGYGIGGYLILENFFRKRLGL